MGQRVVVAVGVEDAALVAEHALPLPLQALELWPVQVLNIGGAATQVAVKSDFVNIRTGRQNAKADQLL